MALELFFFFLKKTALFKNMRKKILVCGLILGCLAIVLLVGVPFFVLTELDIATTQTVEKFETRQCRVERGVLQESDDFPKSRRPMFDVTVLEAIAQPELLTRAASWKFTFDRGFLPTVCLHIEILCPVYIFC